MRQKALALGSGGALWLRELDSLVRVLERLWDMEVGEPIGGGSEAFVAEVTLSDGRPAVLKLSIPDGPAAGDSPFIRQLEALRLASGDPFVSVLAAHVPSRALLLERLGPSLDVLGLPVEEQIDAIAATLARGWRRVHGGNLVTGTEKARWLHEFVETAWEGLARPCPEHVIRRAQAYAVRRGTLLDPSTAVFIHGDAHPANVLLDPAPSATPRYKLVDPDPMVSEPAHDLAIPLRDWSRELLDGDPVGLARAWAQRLGARDDIDPEGIWEWAFVERVSTGLYLLQLGEPAGTSLLRVATLLSDA